jgi:hypothetical protein
LAGRHRQRDRGRAQRAALARPPEPEAKLRLTLSLGRRTMNRIIYIVGLVVVVLAVLAFFGLR